MEKTGRCAKEVVSSSLLLVGKLAPPCLCLWYIVMHMIGIIKLCTLT